MCFSRRKASLSSSPSSSPVSSPKLSHHGSLGRATSSHSPCATPPSSPSVSATPWKSRLHTIKNSFLGSPRFHRRKMQGIPYGYYPCAAFVAGPHYACDPQDSTGDERGCGGVSRACSGLLLMSVLCTVVSSLPLLAWISWSFCLTLCSVWRNAVFSASRFLSWLNTLSLSC